MSEDEQKRLFVAAPVSMATVSALTTASETMKRAADGAGLSLRFVPPANFHITLRYLGWSRPEAVHALRDTLAELVEGVEPLSVAVRGVGAFPNKDKANVLWAGVTETTGGLLRLSEALDRACADLGWPSDGRGFEPHITLARTKEVANVDPVLLLLSEQEFSKFRIDEIVIYESLMKPSGSEYVAIARFGLEGASKRSERHRQPLEPGAQDDFGALDSGLPDSAYDEDGTPPENYEEH